MRCSQPGKKAFCPLHVLPASSSACRSVTALFSFHLPITSGLVLAGCQWVEVTSHRSPTAERTQPLGDVQTHSHGADSFTAQRRDGTRGRQVTAFPCICGSFFFVGFLWMSMFLNGRCSYRTSSVDEETREKRERGRDRWRDFKRHRKCGREARGVQTLRALLILSSVQHWLLDLILKHLCVCVFVSTAVSAQLCVCVCLCQRPNRCALYPFAATESQLVSTYTLQKHHEYLVFRCFLFGFQTFVHYTLYIIHYISYKHARSDPTWEIGQHAKSGG